MVNEQWNFIFPNCQVSHLHFYNSDHRALLIDTCPKIRFRPRPFRLEAIWLNGYRFRNLVKEIWEERSSDEVENLSLLQKF